METLIDYLKSHKPKRFVAKPYYSPDGDSVTFYFKAGASYAQRVDDFLTVYLSMESDELVGCQIKGVVKALRLLGRFKVVVEDDSIRLGMLFMACMAEAPEEARHRYAELPEMAMDAVVPRKDLEPALAGIGLN